MRVAAFLAVIALTGWAAQSTGGAEALFARGQAEHRAGKLAEAERSYRQYLTQFGARGEVLANLGALLAQQERFDEAIASYQKAVKASPKLTQIHLNLGLAYFKTARFDSAVQAFSTFLGADPGNRQARQLRAMSYLESEQFAEAAKDYEMLAAEGDITVKLGLATALTRMGEAAKARALIEPIIEREDSAEIQILMVQTALLDDRPEDAQKAVDRAETLNSRARSVNYYKGLLHWKRQETVEAIAAWRRELEIDPRSFPAIFALGGALAVRSASDGGATTKEAEQFLRTAIALRPKHAPALYQLAKLLWQSKNKEAMPLLERATTVDPKHREAHYLLGSVYQASGRTQDAAREFATVKSISRETDRKYQELFDLGK